ncbi:MAG: LPS export ABC transporter periplasmic protein LptC [Treponema sp.]|nr:LPS export ABC transporter periplasmic protein LptC [Treponema sp.]
MKLVLKISVIFFFLTFVSCSVKMDKASDAETKNPEFVFINPELTQYENMKKTANITSKTIEQYKDIDISYVEGVSFETYKDDKIDTKGSCEYLIADTKQDSYELFDKINIYSEEQKASFTANYLKYDSKTEQLVGSRTDNVHIEKDGIVIYGSGFAASGVTGEYSFSGTVSGEIETDSNSDSVESEVQ